MSDTPNIDKLREKLRRLDHLLDDPHPGLSTWREAYRVRVKELLEWFEVLQTVRKLCDKLDQVAKDTSGIFVSAYIHGQEYKGAQWSKEYAEARSLLQNWDPTP